MIHAGFSTIDITPVVPGRIGRFVAKTFDATDVAHPLSARIAIFDDGKTSSCLVTLDLSLVFDDNATEIRKAVESETGVPAAHVMIACSHTHNSYLVMPWHENEDSYEKLDFVIERVARCAADARARLVECTIAAGNTRAPGFCFNRRHLYRNPDGRIDCGTQGPRDVENYIGNEGPEDDQLQVAVFHGAGGAPIGGIVNFSVHPTTMFGKQVYSSDYVYVLTEALTERYGCPFCFLYGASGNLQVDPSLRGGLKPGTEFVDEIGSGLAVHAIEAIEGAIEIEKGQIAVSNRMIEIEQRRPTSEQIEAARAYLAGDPETQDQRAFARAIVGHDFIKHNNSAYVNTNVAKDVVGTWEYQRRLGTRRVIDRLEIQAIRIAGLALVGFPSEPFCEIGLAVKQSSPFTHTMVASLANGFHGYIPVEKSFEHGGYETALGFVNRLVPEADSIVRDAAIEQLRALKP